MGKWSIPHGIYQCTCLSRIRVSSFWHLRPYHTCSLSNSCCFHPMQRICVFMLSRTLDLRALSLTVIPLKAPYVVWKLYGLIAFQIPSIASGSRGIMLGMDHWKEKYVWSEGRGCGVCAAGTVMMVSAMNRWSSQWRTKLPGKWPPAVIAVTPGRMTVEGPSMNLIVLLSGALRHIHSPSHPDMYTGQEKVSAQWT